MTLVGPENDYQFTYETSTLQSNHKIVSQVTLNSQGSLTGITITGKRGEVPIAESFTFREGTARWKNRLEQGEGPAQSKAFYLSLNALPGEIALLAQALLKADGGKLPLLPVGEARVKRLDELQVNSDQSTRTVVQYAIYGLDYAPVYIWLDEDQQLFALLDGERSVVKEGWEPSLALLIASQETTQSSYLLSVAKSITRKSALPLVFTNATVFDARKGCLNPHTTVVVKGNRIQAVGRDGRQKLPPWAEVIDLKGKVLLPGLWDMHQHLRREDDGLLHLAAGVTTVRDLGNEISRLTELRRKFDDETLLGPRILMTGLIDRRGDAKEVQVGNVETLEDVRASIAEYKKRGYVQIKLREGVKPELVPSIVKIAHQNGLRVSGHVPSFMTIDQFVKAGVDEVQHVYTLLLAFVFDMTKDTRTAESFFAVPERAAEVDMNSAEVRRLIQSLKDKRIVVDPTASIYEVLYTTRPGRMSAGWRKVGDRLPVRVRRSLLEGREGLLVAADKDQRYRDSFRAMIQMIGLLHKSGVRLVAGTDGKAGFSLHRELELYVESGIPAVKVLQMATLGAAQVMGQEKEIGTIEQGKLADLIVVDGDPISNISDIRRVEMVMKNGKLYQCAALSEAIGIYESRR